MKKYFLLKDGKKQGPYDVYKLKDIGIKASTPLCTTGDDDWYNAEDFPELIPILEENPVKKLDYEKNRIFGYKLATLSERSAGHFKSRMLLAVAAVALLTSIYTLKLNHEKEIFFFYAYALPLLLLFNLYRMYYIMKYSSAYGGENSNLKLISADDGKFIHEIAKKDYNRAFLITFKYAFLPDFGDRTNPKKIQTFPERIARVYLVTHEGSGNNPS